MQNFTKFKLLLLMMIGFSVVGCQKEPASPEKQVEPVLSVASGKSVDMHYIMKVDERVLRNTHESGEPVNFKFDQFQLFPKLKDALVGMKKGDAKQVILQPEDAFGVIEPDQVVKVARTNFPVENPIAGRTFTGKTTEGKVYTGVIEMVDDESVVLNLNHPLAGQVVTFDVTIVDVK